MRGALAIPLAVMLLIATPVSADEPGLRIAASAGFEVGKAHAFWDHGKSHLPP